MAGSEIFLKSTKHVRVIPSENYDGELGDEFFQQTEVRFEWMISNFSEIANSHLTYSSPEFRFANQRWNLEMCQNSKPSGWMSLRLCLKELNPRSSCQQPMIFVFGILKPDNEETVIEASPCKFLFKEECRKSEWQTFCRVEDLEARRSELMDSEIVVLTCRVRAAELFEWEELEKASDSMSLENLSADFKALLDNKTKCDVTIKVMNVEFRAHIAVLVARSRVFAAMFEHETLEEETREVIIPDCDPESFGEFLNFLYAGRIKDITFETAHCLYITADKYAVDGLKAFCVECMKRHLTEDILCDVVKFADQFGEDNLMSSAQCFFNRHANGILSTPEWQTFLKNNFRLANGLLTEMASKINPDSR